MVITTADMVRIQNKVFDHCLAQAIRKGNDYSGNSEDTFMNLRMAKIFGIVDNDPKACMVQIINKVSRMSNFCQPGFISQVKDESMFDTVSDLCNYSTYWLMLMEELKHLEKSRKIVKKLKGKKK